MPTHSSPSHDGTHPLVGTRRAEMRWWRALSVYVLVGVIAAIVYSGPPPRTREVDQQVSSSRAMETLAELLGEQEQPHRAGLEENEQLRVRLLGMLDQLGLQTWSIPFEIPRAGRERLEKSKIKLDLRSPLVNIVARVPGAARARPVVLATHYDSAAMAPGAGDAGQCVAAMLETARALRASPLQHEVWLLLTDAEEFGLWGSQALIEQASFPWGQDEPIVINFDARGCRGAVLLYETHERNLKAMRLASSAIAWPKVSSSLMVSVYKRLPNGTDFTVYRGAGWCGWNFAVVAGADRYHTEKDNLSNLSPRSVQHFASHAHQLLRSLDRLSADQLQSLDDSQPAVFFDLLGTVLVVYPAYLNFVQLSLVLLLASAVGWAVRRQLPAGPVLVTLAVLTATIVASYIVGLAMVRGLQAADVLPRNFVRYYEWLVLLFPITASAVMLAAGRVLRKMSGRNETIAAVLAIYLVIGLASSVWLAGGAYLCLWPALCLAVLWAIEVRGQRTFSAWTWCGGPALLYAPTYVLLAQTLGPRGGMTIAAAAALMLLPTLIAWCDESL